MSKAITNSRGNRPAAQQRVDQIGAFREELGRLGQDGALVLSEEQQHQVAQYHARVV